MTRVRATLRVSRPGTWRPSCSRPKSSKDVPFVMQVMLMVMSVDESDECSYLKVEEGEGRKVWEAGRQDERTQTLPLEPFHN